jgi:HD-GYP domain-containing protein (c-di-GMP phosphodiesterase class II)
VVVPIRAGQDIIGVADLAIPLPREIQPGEVHLLTTIAEIAGNAVHRMRLHESLEESYLGTVLALAKALDARDAYINGHSDRIAKLAVAVAQNAGMSPQDQEVLRLAARLHDIGKIGVPDSILRKPAALNEEEWAVMRRHPATGADIIQPVRRLRPAAPLVRHHHERFDGKGYPDGLMGEAIPLGARVLAVVDAFSAMSDDRAYRKARPRVEVLAELERCAGTQFDPNLVKIFVGLEPQFAFP